MKSGIQMDLFKDIYTTFEKNMLHEKKKELYYTLEKKIAGLDTILFDLKSNVKFKKELGISQIHSLVIMLRSLADLLDSIESLILKDKELDLSGNKEN